MTVVRRLYPLRTRFTNRLTDSLASKRLAVAEVFRRITTAIFRHLRTESKFRYRAQSEKMAVPEALTSGTPLLLSVHRTRYLFS